MTHLGPNDLAGLLGSFASCGVINYKLTLIVWWVFLWAIRGNTTWILWAECGIAVMGCHTDQRYAQEVLG